MINRRNLLKLGVLAGAAAFVPLERLTAGSASAASTAGPDVPLFDVPLSIPPVLKPVARRGLVDYYDVTMREAEVEILPGTTTPIWGYNGGFPGPTIKARAGRPIVVRQHNKLPEAVAVHLHGGNVPSSSDGLPGQEIQPGSSRDYFYPNKQRAATPWYHDHAHHMEAPHAYKGLSGLYQISDHAEERLRLPSGRYDVPLVFQDRFFNADGSFRPAGPGEFVGNVNVVNGTPFPVFEVEQRPYRFRLLNASALDGLLDLSLSSGEVIQVIGSDGGLLPVATPVKNVPLAPSERVEVVIDFSKYPIGSQIELANSLVQNGLSAHVMRFDVTRRSPGFHPIPHELVPVPRLRESSARVRRDFKLSFDPVAFKMEINGKDFDPARIDIKPRLGDTEIWTVTNGDAAFGMPHVFHTHLVSFQILDRNGQPPAAIETGWKDSVLIPPGEQVRLIMKFGDFPGKFLYHCHLLTHADLGMMGQMEVVRP
jgi:spore coat protein A